MPPVPPEELFAQYWQPLLRMLYRRTGDQDRAEDLAAETFARAVETPPDNPRPWLFAVALNLVRDDGRRAVRQGRRLQLLKGESTTTAPAADTDYERADTAKKVQAALAGLRDLDREVLLLKAEGFDYDEISAATGLAKGAIGTTIARARRRLVEAVRAEEKDRDVASR